MKKLFLFIICLTPALLCAKELPTLDVVKQRLNGDKITTENDWESMGNGIKQNIDKGILFVMPNSISIMYALAGKNQNEVFLSSISANKLCANALLSAIDMGQNKTLKNNMIETFIGALQSHNYTSVTMVWGYQYKVQLMDTKKGIIANCEIK